VTARRPRRRPAIAVAAVGVFIAIVAAGIEYWRTRQIREALYDALAPVRVTNCELQRFGNANDGGYLMCGNLMAPAQAAYSYGIDGRDEWGCDVAGPRNLPLHQYDCFNTDAPRCNSGAAPRFHPECVGPEPALIDGRSFDTLANQINKNGHGGLRLVMKMDVEGSEWQSLLTAPDDVLDAIDQLAIEFHRVDDRGYLETAARLNRFFHVAHYHHNNYECRPGFEPFAGPVFELLLVNKRIAETDTSMRARAPSPLDAPNNPALADCQTPPGGSEPRRIARWLTRKARGLAWLLLR
jgi:hypothetical protein